MTPRFPTPCAEGSTRYTASAPTSYSPRVHLPRCARSKRRSHIGGCAFGAPSPRPASETRLQRAHPLIENCRGIVAGTRHGPGIGSVRRPARAPRLTGRAPGSYPGTDRVRAPGRALCSSGASCSCEVLAVVAQLVGATACRAEGHGFESRRRRAAHGRHGRIVDVAEWIKAPGYEPGGCRFESCRRRNAMPGSRGARRPVVTRKAGVRAPPWQLNTRPMRRPGVPSHRLREAPVRAPPPVTRFPGGTLTLEREIWDQWGLIRPVSGFDSRSRNHAGSGRLT